MAINARTFQLLYIIRQRALDDETTTIEDMVEFIAERRTHAPSLYDKAYIAPSAMDQMVKRMIVGEKPSLLTRTPEGHIELTVQGSQMADLITDIDACSTYFLDNYKEAVCMAVLRQRQRLGQGPVTPRECAALANISLDSARRGLAAAAERGDADEDRTERTPTYSVKAGAPVPRTPATPSDDTDNDPFGVDNENADLSVLDPEDDEGEEEPVKTNNSVLDALADIDDDDFVPNPEERLSIGRILNDEDEEYEDDDEPVVDEDALRDDLAAMGIVPPEEWEDAGDLTEWDSVDPGTRQAFITQASACGLNLAKFMRYLADTHKHKVREALLS